MHLDVVIMAFSKIQLKDPSLLVEKTYINGEWLDSVSEKTFNVYGKSKLQLSLVIIYACSSYRTRLTGAFFHLDPATGAHIGKCPECTPEDAQNAIEAAAAALPAWRSKSGRERGRILRRWYDLMIENKDDLTTLITFENGKAKADAAGEVLFAASVLEWFSEEAARVYGDVIPHSNSAFRVSVVKEPVGVCGLITP